MKTRFAVLSVAALAIGAAACSDSTQPAPTIVNFKASLDGAHEVPANTTTGSGTFTATLDMSTNVLTYDVTFTGLSANVTLGHIHAPAAVGVNASPALDFKQGGLTLGATTGSAHGVVTLNAATQITTTINGDSLKKLLFAGLTYANIHTTAIPAGEIRGQITQVP